MGIQERKFTVDESLAFHWNQNETENVCEREKNHRNRTQTVFTFDLFELTITMGFIDTNQMNEKWQMKLLQRDDAISNTCKN